MRKTTRACRIAIATLALLLPLPIARAAEPEWKPIHITGRVVDSSGKPIKGVTCLWQWSEWSERLESTTELLSEAVSDADGRFELREHQVAAGDPMRRASGFLWFYAEGHAVHWQSYERLPPVSSNHRTLDVVLPPAKTFSYRVVDPDGHPRIGELIEPIRLLSKQMIIPPPRAIREQMAGTTDETGSFTVNNLSAEQGMMVRVVSERFGTMQQFPNLTRGMPPIVTLQLRAAGEVEGVVEVDRPERLAGRRIQLTTEWRPQPQFGMFGTVETTIDALGRFRASTLAAGDLSVLIEPLPGDDFVSDPSQPRIGVKAGRLAKVTVSTIPRTRITGRVRLADGSVASGVAEVIVPESGPHREIKGHLNRDGEFQIGAYPGPVKIQVEFQTLAGIPVASGTLIAQTTVVTNNTRRVECPDLILPKARMVEGRALTSDGRPLVGAAIYVQFGKRSGVQTKTDAIGQFRYAVAEDTPAGSYMYWRDDRTLVPLERTDDPFVVQLPASTDDSTGH